MVKPPQSREKARGNEFPARGFARKEETVGIVLVTRSLSAAYPSVILEEKKRAGLLITEIPDMKNPTAGTDSITAYVRDAVGIQV